MKKGFTLIELLSVIIILAIILVIAVPQVLKAIDTSRMNAHISNNQMVLKSAELFVANNTSYLPTEIGSTFEITIQTLIDNNVLKEFKLGSNDCSGYVLITKINETDYDYTPHINCLESINTSIDNSLILHYKFNDFKESTENLVISPEFSPSSLGTGWGSWQPSVLTFGSATILGKTTNYTNLTKRTTESTNAIHQAIPNLVIGKSYTLSFYARINPDATQTTGTLRPYINGYVNYSINKNWTRIELTQTATAVSHTIHITQNSTAYDVQIAMVQVEEKPYATPFVNGIREDIIIDYSNNNNYGTIFVNTTPKWILDPERQSGVYQFDGVKTYIDTNYGLDEDINNHTISAWVKNNNPATSSMFLSSGQQFGANDRFYFGVVNGNWDMGIRITSWGGGTISADTNWNFINITFNGTQAKLYVNNVLNRTINYTYYTIKRNLHIGKHDLNYFFNGFIDDFRIYNRVLSEEELKLLYFSTK